MKEHGDLIERLMGLVVTGHSGPVRNIVNEAVAERWNYECPNYDQLPVAMEGCKEAHFPKYLWKDASEVLKAAEAVGFSCEKPVKRIVSCRFEMKSSVEMSLGFFSPVIVTNSDLTVKMEFIAANGITISITEVRSKPRRL